MCRRIEQAALDLSFKSENPAGSGIWFRIHHNMSMASWGEKITITLTPEGSGTRVHILSECGMPTQIVDYGKNAENVAAIFRYLEQGVDASLNSAPMQPSTPVPAATEGVVFCTNCGKKLSAADAFCSACGKKLKK